MTDDLSTSSRSSYKNIGNTIKLSDTFSKQFSQINSIQTLNAPCHHHQTQKLEKNKKFEQNSCSCQ